MKFPKKKIKNINSFYQEYIKVLNQTLKQVDLKKLKLISDLIEKKYYKIKQFLFVAMEDRQQSPIILFVTTQNY